MRRTTHLQRHCPLRTMIARSVGRLLALPLYGFPSRKAQRARVYLRTSAEYIQRGNKSHTRPWVGQAQETRRRTVCLRGRNGVDEFWT